MRTTLALDAALRDRLVELKRRWREPSLEAVVARLLAGGPQTASGIYARKRDEVDAILREHGVKRLVAFGSRARGDSRPDSDLDLAVELPKGADLFDLVEIREELARLLGLRVDVVSLSSARTRLKQQIDQEGVVLFG